MSPPNARLALALGFAMLTGPSALAGDFESRMYREADGGKLPYRLFKPKALDPNAATKYPLILFLHGAGERGTDNEKQLKHAAPWADPRVQEGHPCFVVAPQCPDERRWVEVDWGSESHEQPEDPSLPMRLVMGLIPSLLDEFPIDRGRVYLTGLSMGGYGAWDLAARRPEWFAAVVPICGGADLDTAPKLAKLPVWAFHGAKDGTVPVSRSRGMVSALKEAGGAPKYTEYAEVGHDSWDRAYADPCLAAWLFSQRRRDP